MTTPLTNPYFKAVTLLLQKIEEKGVEIARVTLHVGLGTFRPVKVDNILDHKMHSETYIMSAETARR